MKRVSIALLFALLFLITTMAQVENAPAQEVNSEPILRGRVTPTSADSTVDFLFTVKYSDADNDPPEYVKVFIEGKEYEMTNINSNDSNYTNGKDFEYRTKMPSGPAQFYFAASDGNQTVYTDALTLISHPTGVFGGRHHDLILWGTFLMPAILLILAYGLFQLRGIKKALSIKDKMPETELASSEEQTE